LTEMEGWKANSRER